MDSNTIKQIYQQYYPEILKFCLYRLNNKENAEDIASEVFLRFSEHTPSDLTNIRAWLYKVARNLIYDKYVKKPNITDSLDFEFEDSNNVNNYDLETLTIEKSLLEIIQREINNIDSITADIIILRVWEELPFSEISKIVNVTEATAKLRFKRGIEKLKSNISNINNLNMETNTVSENSQVVQNKTFLSKSVKYALSFALFALIISALGFGGYTYYQSTEEDNDEVADGNDNDDEDENTNEDTEEPEIEEEENTITLKSFSSPNYNMKFNYPEEIGEPTIFTGEDFVESVTFKATDYELNVSYLNANIALTSNTTIEEYTLKDKNNKEFRINIFKEEAPTALFRIVASSEESGTQSPSYRAVLISVSTNNQANLDKLEEDIKIIIESMEYSFTSPAPELSNFSSSKYNSIVKFSYSSDMGNHYTNFQSDFFEELKFTNSPITITYSTFQGAYGQAIGEETYTTKDSKTISLRIYYSSENNKYLYFAQYYDERRGQSFTIESETPLVGAELEIVKEDMITIIESLEVEFTSQPVL